MKNRPQGEFCPPTLARTRAARLRRRLRRGKPTEAPLYTDKHGPTRTDTDMRYWNPHIDVGHDNTANTWGPSLLRTHPYSSVLIRRGRSFAVRRPACASALPTPPVCRPSPATSRRGHRPRLSVSVRVCPCLSVSGGGASVGHPHTRQRPQTFSCFSCISWFHQKKGGRSRFGGPHTRQRHFIFHLSSLIIPLRARANKKNAKNAVFLRNRLENLADPMYF